MRTYRALLVVGIVLATLALPTPASATMRALTISPAQPVAHQTFTVKGSLTPRLARTVQLQRRVDGRWRVVHTTRSSSRGTYSFRYSAASAAVPLRTRALTVRRDGRTYATQTSATRTLRPVRQRVSLAVAPAPGRRLAVSVTATPPVAGRTVRVVGSAAEALGGATLDRAGRATVVVDAPAPGAHAFSATVSGKGLPDARSAAVAHDVQEPLPRIDVTTQDGEPVTSRTTYSAGTLTIDPRGSGLPGTDGPVAAQLRVRGNSTSWIGAKLPLKVKLATASSILGMTPSRDWVLLANFYDRSMLRNEVGFEVSRLLQLPWTPHMQYAELWLNGSYRGLYQLGQGVEAQAGRVVLPPGGQLLEADIWPDDDIEFETARGLDVLFKDPDDPTPDAQTRAIAQVQGAEDSLYAEDFDDPETGYAAHLDIDSFVDWYLANEVMKNVDSAMTNSVFMVLAPDGRLSMGPVWDVDQAAGNRASWDIDDPTGWFLRRTWWDPEHPDRTPSQIRGEAGHWFNRLLADPAFVAKVEARWRSVSLSSVPTYLDRLAFVVGGAADRNFAEGDGGAGLPVGPTWIDPAAPAGDHVYSPEGTWTGEVAMLRGWMVRRLAWMDSQIGG